MTTLGTSHIIPFILTLVLTSIFLIFYSTISPDYTQPQYNFEPFPNILPENVPDSDVKLQRKCKDTLVRPDPGIGCSMCGNDYTPTTVIEGEDVFFNGKAVPPGKWCLPAGKNEAGCNFYTGRAIWSDISGQQKWSCICLYPDLFGGPNCNVQFACRDRTQPGEQSKNVLIGKDGHVWDPNQPNFDPKGKTPYAKDEYGNPFYKCKCDQNKGKLNTVQYTTLPNDPYRCHAEPCTTSHFFNVFDRERLSCDCSKIQKNRYAHSNTTGKCYDMNKICGNWDDDTQSCVCGEGQVNLKCKSDYMTRDKYDTKQCEDNPEKECIPECKDNPGGSECWGPCESCGGGIDKPCPCVMFYDANNKPKSDSPTTRCEVDYKNKTYKCICSDNDNRIKYYGKKCENSCLRSEQFICDIYGIGPGNPTTTKHVLHNEKCKKQLPNCCSWKMNKLSDPIACENDDGRHKYCYKEDGGTSSIYCSKY